MGKSLLASCKHHSIRVQENLVQHPSDNYIDYINPCITVCLSQLYQMLQQPHPSSPRQRPHLHSQTLADRLLQVSCHTYSQLKLGLTKLPGGILKKHYCRYMKNLKVKYHFPQKKWKKIFENYWRISTVWFRICFMIYFDTSSI